MHELGLAQAILSVTLELAEEREVRRVEVRIGDLQRVVPDSLECGFRLLAEGTGAEAAELVTTPVPAVVSCRACGVEGPLGGGVMLCALCGSAALEVVTGDEILVDAVELAGDPPVVLRRPGLAVEEAPHDHPHDHAGDDLLAPAR